MHNFFKLFNIPESLPVNEQGLRSSYFSLQKAYHPDHNKNPEISIDLVNKGYQVLSNSVLAILHILEINKIARPTINNDIDFLSKCMDWQEALLEEDPSRPSIVVPEIKKELDMLTQECFDLISKPSLKEAASLAEKLLYLQNILKQTTKKL